SSKKYGAANASPLRNVSRPPLGTQRYVWSVASDGAHVVCNWVSYQPAGEMYFEPSSPMKLDD
ncbi:MAG: hypothetical protein ACXWLL_05015, partial [Myxococcaceae bacterium]